MLDLEEVPQAKVKVHKLERRSAGTVDLSSSGLSRTGGQEPSTQGLVSRLGFNPRALGSHGGLQAGAGGVAELSQQRLIQTVPQLPVEGMVGSTLVFTGLMGKSNKK